MTDPSVKEIQAILHLISTIIANGLSVNQRADMLKELSMKEDIDGEYSTFDIYHALFNHYEKTRKLEFIVLLTDYIRNVDSFYQDVGAELNNLLYLLMKNNIRIESKANILVLIPFKEDFLAIYESIIMPIAKELGYRIKQANEIRTVHTINDGMLTEITHADLLIADVSGRDPQVFYELGYAHALGKKVIVIVQDPKDIPVDTSGRYIKYALNAINFLAERLRELIKETLQ